MPHPAALAPAPQWLRLAKSQVFLSFWVDPHAGEASESAHIILDRETGPATIPHSIPSTVDVKRPHGARRSRRGPARAPTGRADLFAAASATALRRTGPGRAAGRRRARAKP